MLHSASDDQAGALHWAARADQLLLGIKSEATLAALECAKSMYAQVGDDISVQVHAVQIQKIKARLPLEQAHIAALWKA